VSRPTKEDLWTENEEGTPPAIITSNLSHHEITRVLDVVEEKKVALGLRFCDIAVLYRNRATGRLFESELQKRYS
jgi:superfamily I DNA/RNA helicase